MSLRTAYPSLKHGILVFTLLASFIAGGYAKPEKNFRGIPYYNFFTSRDFESGASSVFITTATDGTIFYGDRNQISLYDGATWHKVYQNNNTNEKITQLLWDPDGKIYAGGFNLFGELTINERNQPVFNSLVAPGKFGNGEAVAKIETTPQAVYLTGRRSFACYDKSSGEMDLHLSPTWITASFLLNGEYYLLNDNNEILRYENKKLVRQDAISKQLNEKDITVADALLDKDGSVIMASERRGLFRFDGKDIKRSYPNFKYSPSNLTTDIVKTSDDRLIIASLGGGITILDSEGNTLEQLGPEIDYRFQSARAINVDKSGAVWVMFNNAIAKVLIDSPLTAIDERIRPSLFYATQHFYRGDLYIRSFYILYKAVFGENGRLSHFVNALPNSDLEIWAVAESEKGLYLNTAKNGIYLLSEETPEFLIESEAYDRFALSKKYPHYLIGANSDTIALYERVDRTLRLVDKIDNPGEFINRLQEDSKGVLWLEYGIGRVGKIELDSGKIDLEIYGQEHGIPPDQWVSLWMHNGIAHITTANETLTLDPTKKPFEVDQPLQAIVGNEKYGIGRSFTDPDGNLWVSANNKNLIFWKQADGSYLRDEMSLSEMGEPYFETIKFLENGDALILTSFEFFHFRKMEKPFLQSADNLVTHIIQIKDPKDNDTLFTNLGDGRTPLFENLKFQHNNLTFTVSNRFTYSTLPPQFQFELEGFTPKPIEAKQDPWNKNSKVSYTNLQPGNYVFKARTKLGTGEVGPWATYPFRVSPPLRQTPLAYLLYAAVFVLLILALIKLNSSRLRKRNLELEEKVEKRTQEIGNKNSELERQAKQLESNNQELEKQSSELQKNATELADALIELNDTQDKLLTTARIAGRAEVATNVLHSVGNVLNSVNIGLRNLDKQVQESRATKLKDIVALIKENEKQLASFLADDEKGKHLISYLDQLSEVLRQERQSYSTGIQGIDENIDHIKSIISTQQTHAKKIGVEEEVHIAELLESALSVTLGESYEAAYPVERDYDWGITATTDKHLVLDVIINLIKNAKESLASLRPNQRLISLACRSIDETHISITVTDNGVGIDNSDQANLFNHGFTTKPAGHGFGLHGSANAIKSIGGTLKLESPGLGKGATATITLPL